MNVAVQAQTAEVRTEFPPWFYGYTRDDAGRHVIDGKRYAYDPSADFTRKATYKSAYGGRTASKTRTVAQWLILEAYRGNMGRCVCAREFAVTLEGSVKPALEWAITHLGLSWAFRVGKWEIQCQLPGNKARFTFEGLERNKESKRGWEGVTHAWVDEAHRMSLEISEIVIPTILRGEVPVEAWFTWNPKDRTNWVWQRFVRNRRPDDVVTKVNWRDNPWFPAEADRERREFKRDFPNRYPHVWEGWPDDGDASSKVLPYSYLEQCVEAWRRGWHLKADSAVNDAGLDIADGGEDLNAYVSRRGPTIVRVASWPAQTQGFLKPTAQRADGYAREDDVYKLWYDSGGVGSPILGTFRELGVDYIVEGVNAGHAVRGPERWYDRRTKNKAKFANRGAQLGFAVRNRALRTIRLMQGAQDIYPENCLFIPADLPNLEDYLAKLSQPMWRDHPTTGKVEIDKRAKEGGGEAKSPDEYDATINAFARDSVAGLFEG